MHVSRIDSDRSLRGGNAHAEGQHYKLGYGFMTKEEIGAMERIGRNRQFTRWLIIGCVNDQVVL